MKKKTTLELVEQSEKVSLYSISFAMDKTTEFERGLSENTVCAVHHFGQRSVDTLDLQKFGRLLKKDIEDGIVTVEEKELKHIDNKEYWI